MLSFGEQILGEFLGEIRPIPLVLRRDFSGKSPSTPVAVRVYPWSHVFNEDTNGEHACAAGIRNSIRRGSPEGQRQLRARQFLSQGWRRNALTSGPDGLAAIDLGVVPTYTTRLPDRIYVRCTRPV